MSFPNHLSKVHSVAQVAPLFAAVIAPFSTLMDIPALTQPWYSEDSQVLSDFKASIILSAIGLFFNVCANGLLIFRFSAADKWWRMATHFSLLCWGTKVIVALVNLGIFGIASRNGPGISYLEGFWCAVASVVVSGIVTALLLFHWWLEFNSKRDDTQQVKISSSRDIRIFGRHFMLQVTWFFAIIALDALIFNRIEGWQYFDSIYFMVVTVLTIGFGDFTPTKTASRIILFPFVIILIAQLANVIGMIIQFFSERTASIKEDWQRQFEQRHHEKRDMENPNPDLQDEIKFLEKVLRDVEMTQQKREISISVVTFFIFWLVGAVVFWKLEGWPYGDALYFCYIFFLTVGYGDFSPNTAGGKVFFVTYSLLAVPVMTSFAVQAVTSILAYISNRRLEARQNSRTVNVEDDEGENTLLPHSELVDKAHARIVRVLSGDDKSNHEISNDDEEELESREMDLANHILKLATKLEGHSRRLLVGHLCNSGDAAVSSAGTLMKADWNVQRRNVLEVLGGDADPELDIDGDGKGDFKTGAESDLQKGVSSGKETLEEIQQYRECFAEILAAGSRMRQLEGKTKQMFERRRMKEQ